MIKINTLCAFAALVAAPVAAEELSTTGEFLDGIAAIVNEGIVLKSQFNEQLDVIAQRAEAEGIPIPPMSILEEQSLDRLVLAEMQLQRAERIGLEVSDAMLNDSIRRIAEQNGVRFEDMPAALAQDGVSYAKFRNSLRDEITIEQLRRIEVGRSIEVSQREIEKCIADLEGNVVVNSDYELSHIRLSFSENASADEIAEVEELANSIYQQLQDGSDFREMAARYSAGDTALEGGSLGWMTGQQVPTLFVGVLQDMGKGDISEPIRASNSFHLVKVDDLRSAVECSEINQVNVRHILITPNEIIDDETARQRLDDAIERMQEGEEFGEIAKLLSDDPGSVNDGGEMPWTTSDTFVPEFAEIVDALEPGVVSEPFRSRYGWHVVEVLDRRVYDNTEDLKELNCQNRLVNGKMGEETQLWIQRLRDQAYVEKRL